MSGFFAPRRLVVLVGLTLAWCALWGSLSAANLLSGVVVSAIVSHPLIGLPGRGGIRLGPLMKFGFIVARDLVASTASVAWEVITPPDRTDEAIIAVVLPPHARPHQLLLSVAVTVTPGTAVIDFDPSTRKLYLHVLHVERADATTEHVLELADLACRALPVPGETEVSS